MCSPEQAIDIFDSLPAVRLKDLHIGRWRADVLRTGHPAEELLPALGWYGKQITSVNDVQPFLFCTRGGRVFPLRPGALPFGMIGKTPLPIARLGRLFLGPGRIVLGAQASAAEVHMRCYRGQLSASIDHRHADCRDHLRHISDNIMMGAAVFGDFPHPLFFVLYHESDDEDPRCDDAPRAAETTLEVRTTTAAVIETAPTDLVPLLTLASVESLTVEESRKRLLRRTRAGK